jgi:ribosome-associated toxin RatA of RatAB toxin-antitoxin module
LHTILGRSQPWLGLGLCALLCAAPRARADATIDWAALEKGVVQLEAVNSGDGLPGVRAQLTVTASRERIWATLLDYEHFPQIFSGIERMQVLEQGDRGATVEFWVDALLRRYRYVLRREYEVPQQRLRWTRVSGDLERIEGSWEIRDTPRSGVHLLIYESYVQAGGLVPSGVIRWVAMRKTRDMSERLRAWIEAPAAEP